MWPHLPERSKGTPCLPLSANGLRDPSRPPRKLPLCEDCFLPGYCLPALSPLPSPGPPCPTHPHALCRCRNLWLIRSFMRKNYPIHLGPSKPHCAGGWTQPPSHLWVYRGISANTSVGSKQGPGRHASWSCWQTWKPEALSSFQNKQIKKVKEKKKLWATPAQNYTENKQAEWATEYY